MQDEKYNVGNQFSPVCSSEQLTQTHVQSPDHPPSPSSSDVIYGCPITYIHRETTTATAI